MVNIDVPSGDTAAFMIKEKAVEGTEQSNTRPW